MYCSFNKNFQNKKIVVFPSIRKQRNSIIKKLRLIPLNKVTPATPLLSEYRPIVVSSYVIKYQEGLILEELQ